MDEFRVERAAIEAVWLATVAAEDGPLPGSRLVALVTPQGWCGQVDPADDQPASAVLGAAIAIADAYGLPAGAITVRRNGEHAAFVWAYRTAGGGDYQRAWPHPPLDGSEYVDIQRERRGNSLLDLVQLTTWARAYQQSWAALRAGEPVDMGQLVRRYTRLRAGILDLLARTPAEQVRDLLLQVGVNREALPDDVATAVGYPFGQELTIPIARSG